MVVAPYMRRRLPPSTVRALRDGFPWLLACIFVLLACGTLAGRLLSAQLDGAEEAVAARIASLTGFDARIDGLRGRFLDWYPVIEVEGLSLGRDGVEVVGARRVRLKIDVVEAVLRGRAVASALLIDDLEVDLERTATGALALRGGAGGEMPDMEEIVSFLYHSDYLDLREARLALHDAGAPQGAEPLARMALTAVIVGQAFDHRGHLEATLTPAGGAPMRLQVHLELDDEPLDPQRRAGRVLVELSDLDLGALATLYGERPVPLDGRVEQLRLRARFDPAAGTDFALRLAAERGAIGGERPLALRNVRLDVEGHARRLHDGDLRLRDFDVQVADEALSLDGARFAWRGSSGARPTFYGSTGSLDAEQLTRLVSSLEVLGPRARRWLSNLDPRARIEATHFAVEPDGRSGALALRARDIALRGYRGVPRVRGVDASAVVYEGGAWIDVDTGAFFLQFTNAFAEGWSYDGARGRIDLRFDPAGLHVRSDLFRIRGPQGRGSGHFALFLPREEPDRRMALAFGIEAADAAFTEAFLPAKLDPKLRGWLARSVRAGRLDRGALLINGAAKPQVRGDRAVGLWFDLRAGRLAFDPAWPTASSLEGRVRLGSDGVHADLVSGRLAGLDMGRTRVRVPRDDAGSRVELEGIGRGDGRSVIRFLRAAPLGDDLAFLDTQWDAVGTVDFDFGLTVPLDGSELERLEIDSELLLDRLRVGQADVELANVSGRLSYRHPGFLTSAGARADLFGGPVDLRLAGNFAEDANGLLVEGRGTAEGRALANWLGLDVLARLAGRAPWNSRLRVRRDGSVELDVEGPTPTEPGAGFTTHLPPPLEAPAAPLNVRMTVAAGGPMDLQLDWGSFRSRFEFLDGTFARGTLALDAPLAELPAVGLSAVGRAAELDVDAWLGAVERWQQDAIVLGDDGGASVESLLLDFALHFDDAHWGEQRFGPTDMALTGFLEEMTLSFAAERLVGRLVIPEDDRPLAIALDRLDLPLDPASPLERPEQARDAGEPQVVAQDDEGREPIESETPGPVSRLFADLDPATVPAMDVVLDAFSDHGEDLGNARFAVRPYGDGIRLRDIQAQGRGLAFGPDAEGRAEVELGLVPWPSTRIVGRLSGEDAERVFQRFDLTPSVDAEAFSFDVDVAWEGALDDPVLTSLDGRVKVDVARGRFLEIDAGGGPLRMVGLLNVDAIARRMRLDFSDIYKRGIAFEEIEGELLFADGRLATAQPLRIVGPQSRFVLTGGLEMETQDLDGELVVTLPVSKNLPWAAAYAAVVANPLAGAGVFVAERLFRDAIDKYSSARYRISGTVDQPEVVFDTIFENEVGRSEGGDDPVPGAEPASGTSAEPLAAVTEAADPNPDPDLEEP